MIAVLAKNDNNRKYIRERKIYLHISCFMFIIQFLIESSIHTLYIINTLVDNNTQWRSSGALKRNLGKKLGVEPSKTTLSDLEQIFWDNN